MSDTTTKPPLPVRPEPHERDGRQEQQPAPGRPHSYIALAGVIALGALVMAAVIQDPAASDALARAEAARVAAEAARAAAEAARAGGAK